MNQSQNELVIRIKPDSSVVVEDVTDGIISVKNIGVDDVLNSIKNSITRKQIIVYSGLLPKNCVAFYCNAENNDRYIVLEFDTGYADITYMKTLYEHFPLPKLVFGFHLDENSRIFSVNLGVTANERLTESTQMYVYPFSNVSQFGLCTGANELPEAKSLCQLSNLPWFILSLPDNDDRYNERDNALRMGHRQLLEHLKDKNTAYYYEKVLIPMDGVTLKQFLK